MKALKSMAACVFTCAVGLGAAAQAAEEHKMTGCLAKGAEGGSFVLAHVEGSGTTVAIAEAAVDLAPHVGHKVEISGETVPGSDPKVHTMKVTAMKHLAASCP